MRISKINLNADMLLKLVIFGFFFGSYCLIGFLSLESVLFKRWTELFGADFLRIISDLTRYHSNHFRTDVHPLFVILLNPLGFVLKMFIGIPNIAAIVLSALFGATCVLMTRSFLKRIGMENTRAVLCSLILGFSTTHIFFGSLPETGIFEAVSMILIYLIFTQKTPRRFHYVFSGLVAFGFLTTNFLQAINAYFYRIFNGKLTRKLIKSMVIYIALVMVLAIPLSVLQKMIWPSSSLFFLPKVYTHELSYSITYKNIKDVAARMSLLMENIFLYNFVAPHPHSIPIYKDVNDDSGRLVPNSIYTFFQNKSILHYYKPFGILAAGCWMLIIGLAIYSFFKNKCYKIKIILCLLTGILIHFSLHLIYGFNEELFLYSGNWTFLAFALIFSCIHQNNRVDPARNRLYPIFLVVFLISLVINNLHFLYNCILIQNGHEPIYALSRIMTALFY